MMTRISQRDVKNLKDAIDMAEDWRGNKHPEEFKEFDAMIAKMRASLGRVRQVRISLI